MASRERLSATVESEAVQAGRAAVAAGRAPSLSAWVNAALLRQARHDERLAALDLLLSEYESEHGVITEDEILSATRSSRSRSIVVRPTDRRTGAA